MPIIDRSAQKERNMTVYNAVRFKVRAGQEQKFIDVHKNAPEIDGILDGALIKTGDRAYCFIGKWESQDKLAAARPKMIAMLDSFRPTLEDLGGGLGVTDPVSGSAVAEFSARKR
jgi:hypothetical protein